MRGERRCAGAVLTGDQGVIHRRVRRPHRGTAGREAHAAAGTKRGAHLTLSRARLDTQPGKPAQRIGLYATVRPVEEVSTFLAGEQPVGIMRPVTQKSVRLRVEVSVTDMAAMPGEGTGEVSGSTAGPELRSSIGPDAEQWILALVGEHRGWHG